MSKSIIIKTIATILLMIMVGLAITRIDGENELKLKNDIKLETTRTKLQIKNKRIDQINQELDNLKGTNKQKTDRLNELEKELKELEKALEARQAEKRKIATTNPFRTQTAHAEPVSASGDCANEIAKYDWNKTVAVNVSRAESGLRPDARGDTTLTYYVDGVRYGDSWGCFQIRYLQGRPSPDKLVNAEFNVRYAYNMYKSQGWSPWSVCRTKVSCY